MIINPTTANFPSTRLRRLRQAPWLREMVAEVRLHPSDLIWPVFIQEGENTATPISSMPGVFRLTLDLLVKEAKEAAELGIPAIALFPVVDGKLKTERGDEALNPDNLVCRAIKMLKDTLPGLGIITDVALDPYTSHGQDGLVKNGIILNDETVEILCKQAINQARAGCDIVAPSDMMDGRIGAIRRALEAEGFQDTVILSYAAKYASNFYGPFRDAVDSAKHLGAADKKTYQMDVRNSDEALREVALDVAEGADMVMVKPAGSYLDIIQRVSKAFPLPVLAYQVSGEYAMIKAASEKGWLNEEAAMFESLIAIKRAGARAILTYSAIEIARQL
ncbi:MAG: porphobilinogen synthase [Rickettsiales bacterium]|jgi:porphobilinogen synthase|nr:porphobilinogen synthase [Rickettsiales bacterium]